MSAMLSTKSYLVLHAIRSSLSAVASSRRMLCTEVKDGSAVDKHKPLKHSEQFVEPKPEHEPFIAYDQEAQEYFSKGVIESQVKVGEQVAPSVEADPEAEPFRQIYVGNEDHGNFTKVELVDQKMWYWVDRLLPKKDNLLAPVKLADGTKYPSGWTAPPAQPPNLTYFVPRTRNNLFPVYKTIFPDEFHIPFKHFGSPRTQPMILPTPYRKKDPKTFKTMTVIQRIEGDVRDFERDLRSWLEKKHQSKILSCCNEGNGHVQLKGEFTEDVSAWLREQGF